MICCQAGLLEVTPLPIGCEQSQVSAADTAANIQAELVLLQAMLSFVAINWDARV